jgi:hypothetical protein
MTTLFNSMFFISNDETIEYWLTGVSMTMRQFNEKHFELTIFILSITND